MVPSVILYDNNKTAAKFGFEAENAWEDETEKNKEGKYTIVQQFKRQANRLNSNNVATGNTGAAFDSGLEGISLKQVYQDWLGYLMGLTRERIAEALKPQDFEVLWPERNLVLVIPNGWNIPEKTALSELALQVRCVERVQDVKFVAESEVALHSSLERKVITRHLQVGAYFCSS